MTPSEREQKQGDALLAAYKAIKDEAFRRSALTWTAVGAYLAFILTAFKASIEVNDQKAVAWAIATWPVAVLAYQFYVRENLEIVKRLSDNIKIEIEGRLRALLAVDKQPLLMEREDPRHVLDVTRLLQRRSDWGVFLGGPLAVTTLALTKLFIHCFPRPPQCLAYILVAIGGTFVGACGAILIRLLLKHAKR